MLYLNNSDLESLSINWADAILEIEEAVGALRVNAFSQPIKPYLRYGDEVNRIIAMPAYVGESIDTAGIKWIASFPDNITKNKPRANSVTILNESSSGIPYCIINSNFISGIRTAAVSGYILKMYLENIPQDKPLNIGILGFGPIGKLHMDLVHELCSTYDYQVKLFDIRPIDQNDISSDYKDRVNIVTTWQEAFNDADILMTCTVAKKPYIDIAPVPGSLQLNVSLRDYKPDFMKYADLMIVDDWDEVCRENTDIENMHKCHGLAEDQTLSISELRSHHISNNSKPPVVMFNPMGLAVFDMAIGKYFYRLAMDRSVGTQLD